MKHYYNLARILQETHQTCKNFAKNTIILKNLVRKTLSLQVTWKKHMNFARILQETEATCKNCNIRAKKFCSVQILSDFSNDGSRCGNEGFRLLVLQVVLWEKFRIIEHISRSAKRSSQKSFSNVIMEERMITVFYVFWFSYTISHWVLLPLTLPKICSLFSSVLRYQLCSR